MNLQLLKIVLSGEFDSMKQYTYRVLLNEEPEGGYKKDI